MMQYLPNGNFEWVENVDELDWHRLDKDSNVGYLLEVDLEYPAELHNLHSDYHLATEKVMPTDNLLSPYSKDLKTKFKLGKATEKLVPNVNDKYRYVLHHRALQFYTNLGMKLTKIHRAIKFSQSPWLRDYIDFNTEKRKNATSDFQKVMYKLLNN
jgi:hypothetical protein